MNKQDNTDDRIKNAQRINLLYQERIACLVETMDNLKEMDQYDISHVFMLVWQKLNEMMLSFSGGGIFGIKEKTLTFYASQRMSEPQKHWQSLSESSKQQLLDSLESYAAKDVLFWNYEHNAPHLIDNRPEQLSFSISLLCNHPDDEELFMFLFRDTPKKPLMSDDIQLVKIVSRIMGWHMNYEFTYQLLLYHCKKIFYPKIK
jgi:hypothetical protein